MEVTLGSGSKGEFCPRKWIRTIEILVAIYVLRKADFKKKFAMRKAEIPLNGEENIELVDYLLYLRNSESKEAIVSELN